MAASRRPLLAPLLFYVHEQLVLVCLLIYRSLTRREGRCLLYLGGSSLSGPAAAAAAAEGRPVHPLRRDTEDGTRCP